MPLSVRCRGRIASDRLLPSRTGSKFREPADDGFDCSGLSTAAYAVAEITLPRTADAQFRTGLRVPTHSTRYPGTSCAPAPPRTSTTSVSTSAPD
jgi:NlpC/P60 family